MNYPKVVELVIFKLKEGVQVDDFINLSHKADQTLQSFSGFYTRTLFYSKTTDQWVDVVYWSDLESAKKRWILCWLYLKLNRLSKELRKNK
ncbi:hypothetical protein ACJROX_06875 [Pseudalkalibacillus sp. A8]|uniref:hypothetical protein n=1 Tax=Pseudalkalibacillus sp. A8 TaxID=3382641 RepID=UPI0038B55B22